MNRSRVWRGRSLASVLRREGRHPSVRRIDHQGRLTRRYDFRSSIPPEVVVGASDVGIGPGSIAPILVAGFRLSFSGSAASCSVSTCLSASVGRPFERRNRRNRPHTLQVWIAPRRTRERAAAVVARLPHDRHGRQRHHGDEQKRVLTSSFVDGHTSTLPQTPRTCIRGAARASRRGDRAACSSSRGA